MSTHNICFCGEIRKLSAFSWWKKCFICCYDDCGKVAMVGSHCFPVQCWNWSSCQMLSSLGKIFSRQHIKIFFLFFPENRFWHFMLQNLRQFAWNVKSCFLGKLRKSCQCVICWISPESSKGLYNNVTHSSNKTLFKPQIY